MLFAKAAIISSLVLLASAQEPEDAMINPFYRGLSRAPTPTQRLKTRDDSCSGTCSECFGAGYINCPGDTLYCYLPGDLTYGLDSCPGQSSGDATTTADASTSTSTSGGIPDFCYEVGATCASCFGPGYIDCGDGVNCYDPSDPSSYCPDGSSSGGSSGGSGSSSSSTCADQYGSGSVPCGTDSCYNPSQGDVCCGDSGYHCEGGDTCSSVEGKCCAPGSTSSSCSGSGSSGGSGLTTTSDYSYPTSSSGLTFNTGGSTTTPTSSGSSATGINQISGNGAEALIIGRGLLVAAGVGALVL